jgi:branched-chain amino acid transport system substrate-binding protein
MTKRSRSTRLLGLVAVLALVATACGDDDDDDTSATGTQTTAAATGATGTTGASATTAAAAGSTEIPAGYDPVPFTGEPSTRGITDTEIKVGGVYQGNFYPGLDIGARARFERANSEGGVHGREITLLGVEDDGDDSSRNLELARTQVLDNEAFALLVTSALFLPQTSDFLAENQVPFFGWGFMPGFCHPNWWGFSFNGCLSPRSFGVPDAPLNSALIDVPADILGVERDDYTVVAFYSDDDAGRAGRQQFELVWKAENILATEFLPTASAGGVQDPTPFVKAVMDNNPDVVLLTVDFGAALVMKGALRAAGYQGVVQDYTTYSPGLLESNAELAASLEGGYSITQVPPFEDGAAATAQIATDLTAIGEDPFVSLGVSIGYWSADLLVQILEATGPDLDTKTFYETANGGFRSEQQEGGLGAQTFPLNHFQMSPCAAAVKVENATYSSAVPFTCYELIE